MKLTAITSLARPLDLTYPTNKAIAVLSLLVFGGGGTLVWMAGSSSVLGSVSKGFIAALAFFLAWAIARELDPDYDLSAFVAAGLALIGMIFWGLPRILVLLWVLLMARLVNRTTGLPARRLDSVALLVLAGWLTFTGSIFVGLITALAFFLDSRLPKPQHQHVLFAGMQMLIVGISVYVNGFAVGDGTVALTGAGAVVLISVLFLVVIMDSKDVRAGGDQTGDVLDPVRVQSAQVLALSTALLSTVWNGTPGIVAILPLWAAILSTAVYRTAVRANTYVSSVHHG
jgi:hypothetical protein